MGLLEIARKILFILSDPSAEAVRQIGFVKDALTQVEYGLIILPFVISFVERTKEDSAIKEQEKKKGTIKRFADPLKKVSVVLTDMKSSAAKLVKMTKSELSSVDFQEFKDYTSTLQECLSQLAPLIYNTVILEKVGCLS